MDQQTPKPDPPPGTPTAPAAPVEPAAAPAATSSAAAVAASANSQPESDSAKAKFESRRTLGIALMAGAFPAIFAIAGAAWALIDKRLSNNLVWFGILTTITLLMVSIYCGGRGVSALSDSSPGKPRWFNRQALWGLAGLICAVLAFGMWLAMPSKSSSEIEALRKQLSEMTERLAVAEELQKRTESDVAALRAEVAKNAQRAQHTPQNQQSQQTKQTKRRHP